MKKEIFLFIQILVINGSSIIDHRSSIIKFEINKYFILNLVSMLLLFINLTADRL